MTSEERKKMKFYGYDSRIKLVKANHDKIAFLSYLKRNSQDFIIENKQEDFTASAVIDSSRTFFEYFFTPQDILLVPQKNDARFTSLAKYTNDPYRLRRVVKRYTVKTSPFDIPVIKTDITGVRSYILDTINHKSLRFRRFPLEENNGIIYKNIGIQGIATGTTPFEYTHEITHTQADSHVGAVGDYFNSEVLSIFMEKLHAYSTGRKEFAIMERYRLNSLMKILEHYVQSPDTLEDYAYIESTIEAEILFNLFLSSDSLHDYILESIQNIFSGTDTLERLLDSLNIVSYGKQKYIAIESNLSR